MAMPLEPLGSARRADGVFEQLRAGILSGELPVGSRLPNERDLALALGVNRSSVREALKRLEFLELVDVRHGQGTFVREVSDSSALQVIEAILRDPAVVTRDLLEQLLVFRRHATLHIVELAAENRREEQLEGARRILDQEETEGAIPERALELDLAWNTLLGEATGNLMYQLITNLFSKLIRRLGPLYYNERRDPRRSLDTHRSVLGAIERRDARAARRLVENMIEYSDAAIRREAERLERAGVIGSRVRGARS
jgi:GntR family transcriptional repressor for pyruvate dehydrogenase complex